MCWGTGLVMLSGLFIKHFIDGEDMGILLTATPSNDLTKSNDGAVDKLAARVVKFKETRF